MAAAAAAAGGSRTNGPKPALGTSGGAADDAGSARVSIRASIELFRRSPRVVGSLEHDLPEVTRAVPEPHKESRHQHPQKSFDLLSEEFTLLRPLLLSDDVDVRRAASCDLVVSDELLVSRHRPRAFRERNVGSTRASTEGTRRMRAFVSGRASRAVATTSTEGNRGGVDLAIHVSPKKKKTRGSIGASDASRAPDARRRRAASYAITFSFTVKRRLTNNYHRPRRRAEPMLAATWLWSTRSPRAAASFPLISRASRSRDAYDENALRLAAARYGRPRGRRYFSRGAVFPFTEGPRPDYAPDYARLGLVRGHGEVQLHRPFPLAHPGPGVVVIHVPLGGGVLRSSRARSPQGGARRRRRACRRRIRRRTRRDGPRSGCRRGRRGRRR